MSEAHRKLCIVLASEDGQYDVMFCSEDEYGYRKSRPRIKSVTLAEYRRLFKLARFWGCMKYKGTNYTEFSKEIVV